MEQKIVDHLFRHQYGKMVATLTRFFGLSHVETIEDAVQDTFIKATLQWRSGLPENPEAWLTKAAKNRTIDLIRQIKAEKNRFEKLSAGPLYFQLDEMFLDHEVEDSQLRMIFVACHPSLAPEEQIAFALKTISGFSMKEIAAALLTKEETIKKRLVRARKAVAQQDIQFEFPDPEEVQPRLIRVMDVIYLIFNEGFHSTNPTQLINQDLCGEAIRLCKLLLKKENFRSGTLYALFALMCFHAARLQSKISPQNEIIDLEHQDRSQWYPPMISLGNQIMNKAFEFPDFSAYHHEASIAAEHLKARSFAETNWEKILEHYLKLNQLHPTPSTLLNIALVKLQMGNFDSAKRLLDSIPPKKLQQRTYLLDGAYADYYSKTSQPQKALECIKLAISGASNELEKNYLIKKQAGLERIIRA